VLFATNFGPWSNKKSESAVDKELVEQYAELVSRIANKSRYNIIFRTHPAADDHFWKRRFSKNQNVFVQSDGNLTPNILNADAVIQNYCTSGLEALICQVPVINYGIRKNSDVLLSSGQKLSNPQEVLDAIELLEIQRFDQRSEYEKVLERFYGSGTLKPVTSIGEDIVNIYGHLSNYAPHWDRDFKKRNFFKTSIRYWMDYRRGKAYDKLFKKKKYEDFSRGSLGNDLRRADKILGSPTGSRLTKQIGYRTFFVSGMGRG